MSSGFPASILSPLRETPVKTAEGADSQQSLQTPPCAHDYIRKSDLSDVLGQLLCKYNVIPDSEIKQV